MATQRIVLHIGLHKTGTTYLQQVMRANRVELARQGVYVPGGKGEPNRTFAVYDLFGRRPRGSGDDRIPGQWAAMVDALRTTDAAIAVLSEEALSLASVAQARKAVRSLAGDREVRVVVTARDLGRVALSAWQEDLKSDETWSWREYADALADPAARAKAPARGFWLRQDLAAVLDTWAAVLPPEAITVVTVPPPGAPDGQLLARFAAAAGFDATTLEDDVAWANTSLGASGAEVLRRANQHLHRRLNQRQYHDSVETTLAPLLAAASGGEAVRLPVADHAWVRREADRIVGRVREAHHPVVGDLDDLCPRFDDTGRRPDDTADAELLEVAVAALAGLTERFARAKWDRQRPESRPVTSTPARAASAVRSLWFRAKRATLELADANPVAERGLRRVLASRTISRSQRRRMGTRG